METKDKIRVAVPGGTLIAYPFTDPNNPGIFIDFQKDGADYALNLSGTECQIDGDGGTKFITHVWGDGLLEDPTHDTEHVHMDEYFEPETEA